MALKYAVIGTGALGGFYGGKLARSGNDVHFLFRSDFDFVKQHGLSIDSPSGDFHLHDIAAYHNVNDMPQCDVILICLKTIHNSMLGRMLLPLMHNDSLVILIQNGLGIEEDLAQALPNVNIAGGLAFICSNKIGPGHIAHLDYGKLNIGSHNAKDLSILHQVCDDFNRAGIPAEVSPNLLLSRWQKLVWNVPFNGMTVVLNTTTDQLMQNDATHQLAYDMMLEVIAGANQCGVALKESFADKMMELTEQMTPYAPSMKLDYDHKRPMEIGYIYSRPLQTALAAGYEMKKVSVLETQLRFIQDGLIL